MQFVSKALMKIRGCGRWGGKRRWRRKKTYGEPAPCEEGVEQEETHASDVSGRGRAILDTDGEDHHGQRLAGGTGDHERPTANLLDDPDGDEGSEEVLERVETGDEKRQTSGKTDGLEDDGGVVGDQVDTTQLGEPIDRNTEHKTSEVLDLAALKQFLVPKRPTGTLKLNSLGDLIVELVDLGIVERDACTLEPGNHSSRLVVLVVLDEPSRGLGKPEQNAHGDEREQQLEGDGEAPLRGPIDESTPIINPVRHHHTDESHHAVHRDDFSSVGRRTSLRLVCGNCRGESADAETGDDATDDDLRHVVGGDLDDCAEHLDQRADEDGAAATEGVTAHDCEEGTDTGTDLFCRSVSFSLLPCALSLSLLSLQRLTSYIARIVPWRDGDGWPKSRPNWLSAPMIPAMTP